VAQWTTEMSETLLDVRGLRTAFHTEAGAYLAVDGVDLTVRRGEIVGLVGESGSGKSVTGFSLLGLIDPPGEVVDGEVKFKGTDLRKLSEEQMRQLRGNRIAMIFQDPLMTLNPVLRIGEQMMEAILTHENVSRAQAEERCREALAMVGIPSPEKRLKSYPHEFSGGMRQRVAIAIAMLNKPDLIICDEPDPLPHAGDLPRAQHRADLDHPRPGRRGRTGRPRGRDVCRPHR
jgi:peptide/nickel transport system ATP-binding protein